MKQSTNIASLSTCLRIKQFELNKNSAQTKRSLPLLHFHKWAGDDATASAINKSLYTKCPASICTMHMNLNLCVCLCALNCWFRFIKCIASIVQSTCNCSPYHFKCAISLSLPLRFAFACESVRKTVLKWFIANESSIAFQLPSFFRRKLQSSLNFISETAKQVIRYRKINKFSHSNAMSNQCTITKQYYQFQKGEKNQNRPPERMQKNPNIYGPLKKVLKFHWCTHARVSAIVDIASSRLSSLALQPPIKPKQQTMFHFTTVPQFHIVDGYVNAPYTTMNVTLNRIQNPTEMNEPTVHFNSLPNDRGTPSTPPQL